jgi:hypothetical protein
LAGNADDRQFVLFDYSPLGKLGACSSNNPAACARRVSSATDRTHLEHGGDGGPVMLHRVLADTRDPLVESSFDDTSQDDQLAGREGIDPGTQREVSALVALARIAGDGPIHRREKILFGARLVRKSSAPCPHGPHGSRYVALTCEEDDRQCFRTVHQRPLHRLGHAVDTTTLRPPQRVESASGGVPKQLARSRLGPEQQPGSNAEQRVENRERKQQMREDAG